MAGLFSKNFPLQKVQKHNFLQKNYGQRDYFCKILVFFIKYYIFWGNFEDILGFFADFAKYAAVMLL